MKFTIDTLGRCVDVQYPDSLGGVRFNPTQRSRELLNTALSELNLSPRIQGRPKNPVCAKNADQYEFLPGAFVKPTFRGKKDGLMAFREYLNRNLVYDTKLYEAGVYGTVRVEFYIELTAQSLGRRIGITSSCTDGTRAETDSSTHREQWTPLLEMGHPCRYLISFPVNFDPGESTSMPQAFRCSFQQEGNGRTAICSRAFAEKPYFCGEQINLALRPVCVIFVPK